MELLVSEGETLSKGREYYEHSRENWRTRNPSSKERSFAAGSVAVRL
jgi:hypothetical protein